MNRSTLLLVAAGLVLVYLARRNAIGVRSTTPPDQSGADVAHPLPLVPTLNTP